MKPSIEFISCLLRISCNMKRFGFAIYCALASIATLGVSIVVASLFRVPDQDPMALFPALSRASVAGVVETLLFQAIPHYITRGRYDETVQFLAMTLPFGMMHSSNGIVSISNAMIVGAVFSLSYLAWSQQAVTTAVLMTSTIHTVHNAVLLTV